ncbi:MAG: NAD(P)/FAD-dependent oxidoreductase [Armatimonadetes bacterium]|nr:NAD(P)/FAD-dependent oxidoreductase [Anaerolineae bacterium]
MFDAVVIGGGLAGCTAAITLAQRQHRVLLLEAGSYPRPKVCGEFLSPESVALFTESHFMERLQKLNPVTIDTLRITAPDGRAWCSRFPSPALGISRFALDQALAAYAGELGADVHEGTRVTQIDGDLRDGFTITAQTSQGIQTFQAATVIAAHGRRSNLDRVLKRAFLKHPQPYIGLKQHFIGPPLPHHIDLHVFKGGYCGISEVEDGTTNVCLLVRQDVFQAASSRQGDSIAQFIAWMGGQNRHLQQWLAQATPVYPDWLSIAQVSLMTKTSLEGDILLAGDSAGMIAPLAGDGMAMAMHTGKLAALSLDRFLTHQQDAHHMKQAYARLWQHTFGERLRLGRMLQSVMLRPKLLSPGLRVLTRFPTVGNWLIQHTRDLGLME